MPPRIDLIHVLAVASEVFPLVKTGGLADVVGALPEALAHEKVAVHTLIPGYRSVMADFAGAQAVLDYASLFGGPARIRSARVHGLDLLVLDAPHLFDRDGGPYADWRGLDFADNAFRFAALCRAGADIAWGKAKSFVPDLVHCHDWQAGLLPAYLHFAAQAAPPTVMTVHNMAFQGQFGVTCDSLGLPWHAWSIEGVESYGRVGYLKAGLQLADRITTVSPTYAEEIRTPGGGMGLDGLLRYRAHALSGILNGIDDRVWNPAADPHLPAPFDARRRAAREASRTALRAHFGIASGGPLFGMVSRLTWQKGVDLVLENLPVLLGTGAHLVALGSGDPAFERALAEAARQHRGRVGVHVGYDEALAHLVQGGADAMLVPSRFEPCGLTQMCALRYGALPVVSRVGGLADTVHDAGDPARPSSEATGISFTPVDTRGLADAIARTVALWSAPAKWKRIQARAMEVDVSWKASAKRYAELFRALSGKR
ncbi:MAG: glycogen synthase GlgA [Burkholderiales bacterium]